MAQSTSSNDIWRAWQTATPLNSGWRKFADFELLEVWRSAKSERLKAVHRRAIELDIHDRLGTGLLRAVGLTPGQHSDGECTAINPTFFASDSCEIDWVGGEVTSLGRKFADVRVLPVPVVTHTPTSPAAGDHASKRSGKGGRKSTYDLVATVLREHFEEEGDKNLSAEKLHPQFRVAFLARFPRDQFLVDPPNVRTLRDHLKFFRQHSAEIGKN